MKVVVGFLLLGLLCPEVGQAAPEDLFRYNEKTGVCENSKKQQGYNKTDEMKLFGTTLAKAKARSATSRPRFRKWFRNGDAECVDFRNFNFNVIIKFSYATLHNWNLRGAHLGGAKFFFANIAKSDLRGAKLAKLGFGYTQIEGRIDRFTTIPPLGCQTKPPKANSPQEIYCRK